MEGRKLKLQPTEIYLDIKPTEAPAEQESQRVSLAELFEMFPNGAKVELLPRQKK
jgi:hypothetical protein